MQKEELNKLYIEHLKGNKDATWQILKHFDPNISFMLKKYNKFIKCSLDDEEDFIQNCHLALLNALNEYEPNKGDLEPCLKMRLKRVLDMTTTPEFNISLDEEIDDNGTTYCDIIADRKNDIKEFENIELLKQAYVALSERDQKVFELYYNEGLTEKEIAERFNITKSGVSRILSRGIEKIKYNMK